MEEERELTFSDIIRIFKRRKWAFIIIFLLTIFFTVIYLFFIATPKYEAKQVIEYKSTSSQPSVSLGSMSGATNLLGISSPTDSGLTTEIEKMKSDWVLSNVVKDLKLVEKANENKSFLQKLRGVKITERNLIDSMKENINIQNIEDTNIIEITYQSSDPSLASSVVSLIYSYYTEYARNLYFENSQSHLKQVEQVFADVSKDYDKINMDVLDFQTKNKLTEVSLQSASGSAQMVDPLINYYSETYMSMVKLESEKNQLEIQKQAIENNMFNMDSEMKEFILTNTEKDTPVKDIKAKLVNDRIELETLKINSPSSPRIGGLEAEIFVLEKELQNNLEAIFSNNLNFLASIDMATFNEYTNIVTQLELFDVTRQVHENMLQVIDEEIAKRSPIMYQYFLLRKEQAILETRYTTLLAALEQERMKASLYDDKFTVITSSYIPESPVSPNTILISLVGLVTGIVLGIFGVFIREVNDKSIKDYYEFESLFGLPDVVLRSSNDTEKIFNYIYQKKYKKFGLLFLGDPKLAGNISKKIHLFLSSLKSSNMELFVSKEGEDFQEKLKRFEMFKNMEAAFIVFEEYNSSDYILYKDELEKVLIFVEEKVTKLEDIEEILKRQEDPIIVYIKK